MQRAFEGTTPSIADSAFVSEMAYLIGDVTLKENASVWPFTCLRGDYGPISIGGDSNVQDFTMLHEATVGNDCIVAAGTLLREDQEVPSGHMAFGAPAEIRPLSEEHREQIRWYCEEYLALSERYRNDGSIRDDGYEDDTE